MKKLNGKELASKLGEYRNDRIDLANRLYDTKSSLYHIIARREKELLLFETDYNKIDIENIKAVKCNSASLQFEDGVNTYSFNYSKNTLFRKFIIPKNAYSLSIDIIDDPYSFILDYFSNKEYNSASDILVKGKNYIILPLYGVKKNKKIVFEKSGLNQWNAAGRKRDFGEIYIPIPKDIHENFPKFFPDKNKSFELQIPTGEVFQAKISQDNSKALMTNPNKALADWLLRKILQLKEGELATIDKLDKLGFDSVIITKNQKNMFKINIMKTDTYDEFWDK